MDDTTKQEIESIVREFLQNKFADGNGVVPPIAQPPPGQNVPGGLTIQDVQDIVATMLQSGSSADAMADNLTGSDSIGEQVRIPGPQATQQFDKTDTQLPQMVRYRKGASNTDTIWEICFPGTTATSTPGFVTQNGKLVPIANGELTIVDNGPWWTLNNIVGSGSSDQITGIYAVVVQNQGRNTSPGDWPVNPTAANFCAVTFCASSTVPPTPPTGSLYGLSWQIVGVEGMAVGSDTVYFVPHQLKAGNVDATAKMGDADCNPVLSPVSKSIVQVTPNVFSINNWLMATPDANSSGAPMLVRVAGVSRLMAQPTVAGQGDADMSSPTQYSIQKMAHPNEAYLQWYGFAGAGASPATTSDLVGCKQVSSSKVFYVGIDNM